MNLGGRAHEGILMGGVYLFGFCLNINNVLMIDFFLYMGIYVYSQHLDLIDQ